MKMFKKSVNADESIPMKVIVTGAAGFIGFFLAMRLLQEGWQVVGIDNLNDYYDVKIKQRRLDLLQQQQNFRFSCADIADLHALTQAIGDDQDADLMVHMAAQAGVRYSLENPQIYERTNIAGQVVIFEAVRAMEKCPPVLYASSSSVYGNNQKIPFHEKDATDSPASLYAATKKSGELIARTYAHLYGLRSVALRFFTVYGPHGRPDMAPWLFTRAILHDEPIKLFNHGKMSRDFTYIDDIIDGVMGAVRQIMAKNLNLQPVYNLGNSYPVQLMDFVGAIERAAGKVALKEFHPMQAGDVPITYADITAARRDLGFAPKVGIEQGMAQFVAWYQSEMAP